MPGKTGGKTNRGTVRICVYGERGNKKQTNQSIRGETHKYLCILATGKLSKTMYYSYC